ncbi:MAG: polyprenyl diphosphate synthase [bacterium]
MERELKIDISGIVQGVYLRKRVSSFANMLGIKGFVKNQPDGTVSIIAQGRETALEELLHWIQKAPFPIKLSGMSYQWREIEKKHKQFDVAKDKDFISDHALSFLNLGKEVLTKNDINVPNHVAIIPDGNRRWARERGWYPWIGHRKAVDFERLKALFQECKTIGVKYLTFWAFSTENWSRDEREIKEIFLIIKRGAKQIKEELIKENIQFRHMGRRDRLPKDVMKIIDDLEKVSQDFTGLHFQLCLDYNGRDDLVRAFKKMKDDNISEITEKLISEYLDSKGMPDPDLIIRTSGEKRTSGIMAYQAAYAELYFTNVYFPDFDAEQFKRAILDYSQRTRRFGGTIKKEDHKKIADKPLIDPDIKPEIKVKEKLAV